MWQAEWPFTETSTKLLVSVWPAVRTRPMSFGSELMALHCQSEFLSDWLASVPRLCFRCGYEARVQLLAVIAWFMCW